MSSDFEEKGFYVGGWVQLPKRERIPPLLYTHYAKILSEDGYDFCEVEVATDSHSEVRLTLGTDDLLPVPPDVAARLDYFWSHLPETLFADLLTLGASLRRLLWSAGGNQDAAIWKCRGDAQVPASAGLEEKQFTRTQRDEISKAWRDFKAAARAAHRICKDAIRG